MTKPLDETIKELEELKGMQAALRWREVVESALSHLRSQEETVRRCAEICRSPEPMCCERPVHGGFDEPPECCGNWEPRAKTSEECAAAILAAHELKEKP